LRSRLAGDHALPTAGYPTLDQTLSVIMPKSFLKQSKIESPLFT